MPAPMSLAKASVFSDVECGDVEAAPSCEAARDHKLKSSPHAVEDMSEKLPIFVRFRSQRKKSESVQ